MHDVAHVKDLFRPVDQDDESSVVVHPDRFANRRVVLGLDPHGLSQGHEGTFVLFAQTSRALLVLERSPAPFHLFEQDVEQRARRNGHPGFGEDVGGARVARCGGGEIDTDTHHHGETFGGLHHLGEEPRDFPVAEHQVVRPLETWPHATEPHQGRASAERHARHRQMQFIGVQRWDQEDRAQERRPGRRLPDPIESSASSGLEIRVGDRPFGSATACFVNQPRVRGIDVVEMLYSPTDGVHTQRLGFR